MTARHRPVRTLALLATVPVLALAAACSSEPGETATAATDATDAADAAPTTADAPGAGSSSLTFSSTTVDGAAFDGASLAGRDAVLWFWAPWCTTCRGEAPDLVALHDTWGEQVELVGVASLGGVAEMQGFVEDTGTGGFTHLADEEGEVWRTFGVVAQPAFAFVDDTGAVEVVPGVIEPTELDARVRQLVES